MTAPFRRRIIQELDELARHAKATMSFEGSELARLALGLAQDLVTRGKDAVLHLKSLRQHVQNRMRS